MRKFEIIAVFFLVLLLAHRVWAGVELQVLLRTLLTVMSIFYMWFGFFLFNRLAFADLFSKEKRRGLSRIKVITSILFGFLYSFGVITILVAVNFYAAMNTMIIVAFFINLFILIACLLIKRFREEYYSFFSQFIWRSSLLMVLFLFLWITPVEKRLHILYRDHPRFIEAYEAYVENPDDPDNLTRLKEERSAFR